MNKSKRFYLLSLAILVVLSAYPLINGVRMSYLCLMNGALEPQQYAKYVIPYAAICVSLLCYAALEPLLHKLKKWAFPLGIAMAGAVFFALERFFETMQIHTTELTLINTATLEPGITGAAATVDMWQAALCVALPAIPKQQLTYAWQDRFYYIIGDATYKIHYYLISLMMITMVSGLIFGIARMLRFDDLSQTKPLFLRGVATAVLVALCVFANATAFFRQAAPVQTPLAAFLTGLFFVSLGAAAGVYLGSYLLNKGWRLGIGLPVLLALSSCGALYAAEAAMMRGNLYRFGIGWFFSGLPGLALAPVDILIILLSGAVAWLILVIARKLNKQPGKRLMIAAFAFCVAVALSGPILAKTVTDYANSGALEYYETNKSAWENPPSPLSANDEEVSGCYVFAENIYTNPFSSFTPSSVSPPGGLPYVYGFEDNEFFIADTSSGKTKRYRAEFCKTPVSADEFTTKSPSSAILPPALSEFTECYLLAVMPEGISSKYRLYSIDGQIWLAELQGSTIWSIYRLKKTTATMPADLKRASPIKFYSCRIK